MKVFIALLAALCCTAWASTPSQYIDYDNCEWVRGSPTNKIRCKDGFIGTGACGNKGQNRCDGSSAFALYCCKMRNSTITGVCTEKYANKGDNVECASGSVVYGTCGSLDMSRCSHDGNLRCITIECCPVSLPVDYSSCSGWQYAANQGENLFCKSNAGSEQVLVGRCGSETMAQCGGGNVHGIRCCDLA